MQERLLYMEPVQEAPHILFREEQKEKCERCSVGGARLSQGRGHGAIMLMQLVYFLLN